jgi:hypothetical protein
MTTTPPAAAGRGPWRTLALAACALGLGLPAEAPAQPKRPVTITGVRVGFPSEGQGRRCRVGAWAPVFVDVESGEEGFGAGDYQLVVETADGDAIQSQYMTDLPAVPAESRATVQTYVRPGNLTGKVTLTARARNGSKVHEYEEQGLDGQVIGPGEVLYLTAGARLPELAKALKRAEAGPKKEGGKNEPGATEEEPARSVAHVDGVDDLPAEWFGYQGVDVLVLSTAGRQFTEGLLARAQSGQANPARAIGEWVRRGGRLVVGVGANRQLATPLLERMGLGDLQFDGTAEPEAVPEMLRWTAFGREPFPPRQGRLVVARIRPAARAVTLVSAPVRGEAWPVVALTPYGLGQVVVVAFDLNSPALAAWKGQADFWDRLTKEVSPRAASGPDRRAPELGSDLQRGLESFEEVPVVSFGWVALFILVYLLIVGPLDYFFLKKVVKRLEWTWVTFPIVVLLISVAAYFTAYAVKGNDLRVNKVDVVDIDLRDREVCGQTWLALFSPRLQAYTVGVEPAGEWAGPGAGDAGPLVGTLNPPDDSYGGVDRPASGSLFRRPYNYADRASGVRGVPIPVWAARSFTAGWHAAPFKRGEVFEVEDFGLSRGEPRRLVGGLTNLLPAELADVSLFYKGKWYPLRNIAPGETVRVDPFNILEQTTTNVTQWLGQPFAPPGSPAPGASTAPGSPAAAPGEGAVPPSLLMKAVLFHAAGSGKFSDHNNGGLRGLDQGWRLRALETADPARGKVYLDEAILVGRVAAPAGKAEEAHTGPASPTRLWLSALPGEGERPELKGFLRQETYVRVYIPVPREESRIEDRR